MNVFTEAFYCCLKYSIYKLVFICDYLMQEKLHLENLKASNRVLSYIRHEWKEASQRLAPFMNLKKTVKALRLKVSI